MNAPASAPFKPCVAVSREQIYQRQRGLVSPALQTKRVGVVGLGAGSQLVLDLVKHGLGWIVGVEFDHVEMHNLPRTAYSFSDGLSKRLKVECMERILREHNPLTEFVGIEKNYCNIPRAERHRLFRGCDLLIYLADSFEAAALLNEDACALRIPALFVGIQEEGASGRIIYQVPGRTPCYRCVAHDRYAIRETAPHRLNAFGGECALADVKFIDAVALKIALALLEREEDSTFGEMGRAMIEDGRNEVIVRTHPTAGFGNVLWDALLNDLPSEPKAYAEELKGQALFAMDTVWLQTNYRHDCDCCQNNAQ